MSHFKEVCPYGQVVRQCRCPGGEERVVPCPSSHKHAARATGCVINRCTREQGNGTWVDIAGTTMPICEEHWSALRVISR